MTRFFVVFTTCLVAITFAQQQKLSVEADLQAESSQHSGIISYGGDHGKKYSSSAELTSLAHSSAQQAKTAVRSQQTAGLQAALGAQSGYARAALEAASAAQVALVAKQVIVQHLERELHEAEHQAQAERAQYQQALEAAKIAQFAAQQSQSQLGAATAALATIQQSVQQIERAAAAASSVAANQRQMVVEAEQHLAHIHAKVVEASSELHATEESARRAANAAQVAQSNAAASAQLAAVSSVAENQVDEEHDESEYHH